MNPKILEIGIKDVSFGENVTIVNPVNLYGCIIGDHCFIGPYVEIQKQVTVGDHTRIQSHSFICELVDIGKNCFIGHGVMFINDLFQIGKPAGGNKDLWKQTKIGNNVFIGSNSTILPLEICSNVVIGAGSVVTRNITEPGIYAGNPASFIRKI
jgi:acetyltransferase-like isoleucine patch superfamily enzyme